MSELYDALPFLRPTTPTPEEEPAPETEPSLQAEPITETPVEVLEPEAEEEAAMEAIEAALETPFTQAQELELIAGLDLDRALETLRSCAVLKAIETAMPSFTAPLDPQDLGLPEVLANRLRAVGTEGRMRLFPETPLLELKRAYSRVTSWAQVNAIPSSLGRLVTARLWEPAGGFQEPADWTEVEHKPGTQDTFREVFSYGRWLLQRAVDDAHAHYEAHIATLRAEYEPLSRAIYQQIVAIIRADPDAYPAYAAQPDAEGLAIPAINGVAISEDRFVEIYWDNVRGRIPKRAEFRIAETKADQRAHGGFLLRYEIAQIPLSLLAPPNQYPAFAQDLGGQDRQENINTVLNALLNRAYSYIVQVARNLLEYLDDRGDLASRSVARLRNLYRNIDRINVLRDHQLNQLARAIEGVAEAERRDWTAVRAVLAEAVETSYAEAHGLGLELDRAVLEDAGLEAPAAEALVEREVVDPPPPEPEPELIIERAVAPEELDLPPFLRGLIPTEFLGDDNG
jgi:hypothetical protein